MARSDGGPAFGSFKKCGEVAIIEGGLTVRDWFATFAPVPTDAEVNAEGERDRLANPHGDSHKPKRRSAAEIRSELRYRYADVMLKAREREVP